jgi:hypothetical protein
MVDGGPAMTDSIDGVDRRMSRFRQETIIRQLVRHQSAIASSHQATPPANRETPDASQVIGIPLFIMHTPAWRRQPWHEPQEPPSAGGFDVLEDYA